MKSAAEQKEYLRQWHLEHRDQQLEKQKAYYRTNKEHQKAQLAERMKDPEYRAAVAARRKKYRDANKEKCAEIERIWRVNNKERKAANDRAYRANNPARVRTVKKLWEEKNRLKVRAIKRKYALANPELARVHASNRRLRKGADRLSPKLVSTLMVLQLGKCANCHVRMGKRSHLDHIEPLSRGGRNIDANMQLLCPPCNQRKSNKDPIAWAQSQGRLL